MEVGFGEVGWDPNHRSLEITDRYKEKKTKKRPDRNRHFSRAYRDLNTTVRPLFHTFGLMSPSVFAVKKEKKKTSRQERALGLKPGPLPAVRQSSTGPTKAHNHEGTTTPTTEATHPTDPASTPNTKHQHTQPEWTLREQHLRIGRCALQICVRRPDGMCKGRDRGGMVVGA